MSDKYKPLSNPGMQEMERVVLQLYSQKLCTRQDIADLSKVLTQLVNDLPDSLEYKH